MVPRAPVPDRQLHAEAALVRDEQAQVVHLGVVVARRVDRRPDRHHQLHAEPVEFGDHAGRVRPFLGVEPPVALPGPVEVVDDDHRQGQSAPLVLACHVEQLVLGPVPELALPEPRRPFRQHGRPPGDRRVPANDVRGHRRGRHPVVPLAGRLGHPAGGGGAEFDPADGRVVPQESVAGAGQQEGDADLGVELDQLDHGALLVELSVLMLAEAVAPLAVARGEQHLDAVQAGAVPGGRVPPLRRSGEVRHHLREQHGAVRGAGEPDPAFRGDLGGNLAVDQPGDVRGEFGPRAGRWRRREQRTGEVVADGRPERAAHPDAVRAPGLDPHGLVPATPDERCAVLAEGTHAVLSSGCRHKANLFLPSEPNQLTLAQSTELVISLFRTTALVPLRNAAGKPRGQTCFTACRAEG